MMIDVLVIGGGMTDGGTTGISTIGRPSSDSSRVGGNGIVDAVDAAGGFDSFGVVAVGGTAPGGIVVDGDSSGGMVLD